MNRRIGYTRLFGLGCLLALMSTVALAACTTEKQVEVPVPQTVVVPATVIVERTVEVPVTVAPAPTTKPAATATPAPGLEQLNLAVDMVRGHSLPQGPTCALTSQYQQGEMVVWRMRIYDPATGKQLPAEPADLIAMAEPPEGEAARALATGIKATVHLGDGQTAEMHFGPHGRDADGRRADYFWTWGWDIPADYPTGQVDYSITVEMTDGGKSGRWEPLNVGSSKLMISERTEGELIVAADMVRGHVPSPHGPSCALVSQYRQGEMVVFRAKIWDPETGKQLPADPEELIALPEPPEGADARALAEGMTVTVHLSDGQSADMHFGPHGRDADGNRADYFWTWGWEVPADYPTGGMNYYITVDWPDENKSGRWDPPAVSSSWLTILASE